MSFFNLSFAPMKVNELFFVSMLSINALFSVINFGLIYLASFTPRKNIKNIQEICVLIFVFYVCLIFLYFFKYSQAFKIQFFLTNLFLLFVGFRNFFFYLRSNFPLNRMEKWIVSSIFLCPTSYIIQLFYLYSHSYLVFLWNVVFQFLFIFSIFIQYVKVYREEYSKILFFQKNMSVYQKEMTIKNEKIMELVQIKSEFLTHMSHELRTPLNGILGSAALLLGTHLKSDQKEYLESIRGSGYSLLVLINEILDYSKIESNKLELEFILFEINQIVENVIEYLTPMSSQQNTQVYYIIDKNVPTYGIGDMARVQQVLTHVADNAVKFTKDGMVFIHVYSKPSRDEKYFQCYFSVKDTGVGIDKKDRNKLFQIFSQLDGSSTRSYGGTGLGLSIAKKLTNLMDGDISVKSEIKKGSTFEFYVSLKKDEKNGKDLTSHEEKNEKINIILIEKLKESRHMLKTMIESWGFHVFAFESLDDFLISEIKIIYHIVLAEVSFFKTFSGSSFVNSVRNKIKQKEPLYFVSLFNNRSEHISEEKIIPQNFQNSITKPVKLSILLEALNAGLFFIQNQEKEDVKVESIQISEKYPLNILVAEDNIVNQKLMTNVLKKFGYSCSLVFNGNEVLEALTRQKFDLILMDVQMPEKDGVTTTIEIRKMYPDPKTRPRILAMTAHVRGEELTRCTEAGMEGFVSKPLDLKELKKTLEFWGEKVAEGKK